MRQFEHEHSAPVAKAVGEREPQKPRFWKQWQFWTTIAGIVISALLAINAFLLYAVNDKMSDIQEAAMRPQLIFYVQNVTPVPSEPAEIWDSIIVKYSMVNAGNNTAVGIAFLKPHICGSDEIYDTLYAELSKSMNYSYLAPRESRDRTVKAEFYDATIQDLAVGKTLYLHFYARYEDILGNPRSTCFVQGISLDERGGWHIVERFDRKLLME
ncbi:MAG: hypothetical protein OEW00_07075 [candidate division Zixibacteria bacterium]|nr:hypothetical protein [candidate division Zixibacteria bacterium]